MSTIQDTFFHSVKNNFEADVIEKTEYLLNHFYDTVREKENKEGTVKARIQERGVDIVTFFGDKKRNVGTQFPEKHPVSLM